MKGGVMSRRSWLTVGLGWLVLAAALAPMASAPAQTPPLPGSPALLRTDQASVRLLDQVRGFARMREQQYRHPDLTAARPRPKDWAAAVDATWGPGAPTEQKLEIFDAFWNAIDQNYASFQNIKVNWDKVRARYRPEIAAGVSRGRFQAIMNYAALELRDSHVNPLDLPVAYGTPLIPGMPIVGIGQWYANNSGTCGTAQPDGSTLIYRAAPHHPLGLQAGDRILGYDGQPWKANLNGLLKAQLPLSPIWWGSSPSAYSDTFMGVANINWHLFKTMDVLKYSTGKVVHLPTQLLAETQPYSGFCDEELDIPSIPKPDFDNFQDVTYGLLPGTNIGYIYVVAWDYVGGPDFTAAVQALTQDRHTDGLIIDHRFDAGGHILADDDALDMLFQGQPDVGGFDQRSDPSNHFAMELAAPLDFWRVGAHDGSEDPRSYDEPIAILEGSGTVSMGDHAVTRLRAHPLTRTFGRPEAAAFGPIDFVDVDPDWAIHYPFADVWTFADPTRYLSHQDLAPDQPVWLTPADVAAGKDTVVDAAVRWIDTHTHG
ncbi:MAG: S41 family peptidase [Marmoricola sp.]